MECCERVYARTQVGGVRKPVFVCSPGSQLAGAHTDELFLSFRTQVQIIHDVVAPGVLLLFEKQIAWKMQALKLPLFHDAKCTSEVSRHDCALPVHSNSVFMCRLASSCHLCLP